jgi:hypothetical protein
MIGPDALARASQPPRSHTTAAAAGRASREGSMNLQSEIDYFNDMAALDQARFLALLLHEISVEARQTYGSAAELIGDGLRMRFLNEMVCRVARFTEQLLAEDANRPANDVLMRMLLAPRTDKTAQQMILNAYRRATQGFDRYDATVTMGPR